MAEVFKVVIDGLQSRDAHATINAAIQQAVVTHLAGRDVGGGDDDEAVLLSNWRLAGYVARVGLPAIQADLADRTREAVPTEDRLGRFEVNIDGLDLRDEERTAIAADIQKAVLPHIAALDLGARVPAMVLRPPGWLGLILKPLEPEELDEFRV
ncbi:hypothetical protein GGC64_005916 [Mycobacterium sp. OAS707]|uniref:hypothetical protein n=1 Tax=Mycobacterium sp. OAS707 TaxID=2663822 RepID=UPI00178AEF5E|nr:hypothetical protein [Mycobacterium sp. OAS707]MBE1551829.1 hypothetical protein [Mycobacterium sp. OAS707]